MIQTSRSDKVIEDFLSGELEELPEGFPPGIVIKVSWQEGSRRILCSKMVSFLQIRQTRFDALVALAKIMDMEVLNALGHVPRDREWEAELVEPWR